MRCCGSSAYPWNSSLSTGTLVTAFRIARIINCIKSDTRTAEEEEVITRTLSLHRLHTIVKADRERRIIEVPHQDMELVKRVFSL
jgi:hypothetical protein